MEAVEGGVLFGLMLGVLFRLAYRELRGAGPGPGGPHQSHPLDHQDRGPVVD
ncbi:MAG: hypothetical protein ABIS47_14485 [Acidimicrobiales bacterium]